jgi:leucine dehydrogenase
MLNLSKTKKYYRLEALMRYANILGFEDVHIKMDRHSGLQAIIAIHNVDLGPAIGGCRFIHYDSTGPALKDALQLAYMMTLKAAISGLPHGGAKAVILAPRKLKSRTALFTAFGDFVHELNGKYITACDSGTTTADMDIIATRTPYVIGAAGSRLLESNPAIHTAKGVFMGLRAAVKHQLKRNDLTNIQVAIQGAGAVGYELAALLHNAGALITVCDTKAEATDRFKLEFNAKVVDIDSIYDVDCDIFSPCALGSVINSDTINRIKASIIAGSANNQLGHQKFAETLKQQNILYAPDFVINSGGLINAALVYDFHNPELADKKIGKLYETMLSLFIQASRENKTPLKIAEENAIRKLEQTSDEKNRKIESILESTEA